MTKLLRRLFAATALLCLAAGPNWCQPCEDPSQLFCEHVQSAPVHKV